MKATGVVRRIDDLGRIVIPKEIRRNLRIREGDSLEIYTDGTNSIILKKYSHIENINNFIIHYVDAVYASNKKEIIITDTERIIAAAGNFRKDIIGKKIDLRLDDRIQKKTTQIIEKNEGLEVTDNLVLNSPTILKPISVYGDIIGAVIVIGEGSIGDTEKAIAEMTSSFLGKYLES
ncbi:MAG TPA: AbrB/MazE/SpoVT family DNA-binding domain-containing protein [Acholeplasmataceae bacterium]|jgi:AbrB family transcriptional regulator (stage V sporulation protein T)|nr:AbrB/MazE/SpoVT family DNA-binding domain-containing protein [Acholeplasmataceae bacterium]